MTTDSLEEARDRLHKAIDDRADCLVIEALVDGVVAAARAEVIREVEAVVAMHDLCGGDCVAQILAEDIRSVLRGLSQGGEGNGDNT